uniref:RING-type domain-containing protein n=1 Tax=Magallana gigas TaxID=29159 RepID=A0A8W8JK01_MAGGI
MATAAVQTDLTICSICFEKFKTPKILPCFHVFCQSCISSYIVSSCESKVAPVGFSCPLCREFVPSPAAIGQPEIWAESLPICEIIEKLVKLGELKLCLPCQRENEEETAIDMCITCEEPICGNCTKYHKRILTTRAHLIIPLNEPSRALQVITTLNRSESCPTHPDRDLELHCNDHQKPCCALCVSTEHRKCSDVETIKSAAEKAKKSEVVTELSRKINEFEKELSTSKGKYEENLTEIESKSDSIKEETKILRKEINDHLNKIENEHLNELGDVTKKSSEILNKCIDSVSDRIHFSRHCIQRLQNLEDASDACIMKEYHHVRETFNALEHQTTKTKGRQLKLESIIPKELEAIRNLTHFRNINLSQSEIQLSKGRNVSHMSLSLVFEFQLPRVNICSGTLLSDENIVLANHNNQEIGLIKLRLKKDTWETVRNFESCNSYFDAVHTGDKIYATNNSKKSVTIMTSDCFNTVGEFKMREDLTPFGISIGKGFLFVACDSAILKYSLKGQFIQKYHAELRSLYITVTEDEQIVYSNTTKDSVTCIKKTGQIQWEYKHSRLKSPHSVDRDELDNLFQLEMY